MTRRDDLEHFQAILARYRSNGDWRELLAIRELDDQQLNLLLWMAIDAAADVLVQALEERGAGFPVEEIGNADLVYQAVEDFDDPEFAIPWLFRQEADLDGRGLNDWTPLHLASRCGKKKAVEVLLALGADANSTTSIDGGWTPLMEAAAGGHALVAEQLLRAGADAGAVNSYEQGDASRIARFHGHADLAALLEQARRRTSKG